MTDNISLNQQELDAMRILLYKENDSSTFQSLSKLSPFFKDFQSKVDSNAIAEWILSNLSSSEDNSWVNIPTLTKCVTIRDEESVLNKDLRLNNCFDSYVYIDCPINSITITNCINCTVMVAAARRVCTIDKCEKVNLTVACDFLRINSCVDCNIYSYSIHSPFIFGDNRFVIMAPFNTGYLSLKNHVESAGLQINEAYKKNFLNPF
jgi:hypothetical protein